MSSPRNSRLFLICSSVLYSALSLPLNDFGCYGVIPIRRPLPCMSITALSPDGPWKPLVEIKCEWYATASVRIRHQITLILIVKMVTSQPISEFQRRSELFTCKDNSDPLVLHREPMCFALDISSTADRLLPWVPTHNTKVFYDLQLRTSQRVINTIYIISLVSGWSDFECHHISRYALISTWRSENAIMLLLQQAICTVAV